METPKQQENLIKILEILSGIDEKMQNELIYQVVLSLNENRQKEIDKLKERAAYLQNYCDEIMQWPRSLK